MDGRVEIRPTIDGRWLAAAAEREPVEHAYALWDLERFPDRIRVASAVVDGRPVGYLMIWLGLPRAPIVHWHGTGAATAALAAALPPRPLVAIVPPEVRDAVVAARGDAREYPQRMMYRGGTPLPAGPDGPGSIRPLGGDDAPELRSWAAAQADPSAAEYTGLDPSSESAWGAFEGGRLVGAARAAVRLPREWVVAGVYVEPRARRLGFGRRLVGAIVRDAARAGAHTGLFVREDRPEARRLYEALGFRTLAHRIWLDLGTGLAP